MKRTCIFASYDKEGVINKYVVSFLKYIREISDEIIFVSDCNFPDSELKKIERLISYHCCEHHGEYDFGSYKKGLLYLLEKDNGQIASDELILCNDSCFCISNLSDLFNAMSKKKCDFWGATSSLCPSLHLQSFFLVIKNNVANSDVFLSYFKNVRKQSSVLEVINCYEVPFFSEMEKAGFVGASFLPPVNDNPTFFPIHLIQQGLPLVKKKVFSEPDYSKQSLFKLGKEINQINQQMYLELLDYYKETNMLYIWFNRFFKRISDKFKKFKIIKIDYFSSGSVRYRFLGIPFFFKIKK